MGQLCVCHTDSRHMVRCILAHQCISDCNSAAQVVDVSKQRQMVQEFLELVDTDFAGQALPSIPNLPPKPAQAPDASQVILCSHICHVHGKRVPISTLQPRIACNTFRTSTRQHLKSSAGVHLPAMLPDLLQAQVVCIL